MRQKVENWQPSWIMAAILIFVIWYSDQNSFLDPYLKINTENETFA